METSRRVSNLSTRDVGHFQGIALSGIRQYKEFSRSGTSYLPPANPHVRKVKARVSPVSTKPVSGEVLPRVKFAEESASPFQRITPEKFEEIRNEVQEVFAEHLKEYPIKNVAFHKSPEDYTEDIIVFIEIKGNTYETMKQIYTKLYEVDPALANKIQIMPSFD